MPHSADPRATKCPGHRRGRPSDSAVSWAGEFSAGTLRETNPFCVFRFPRTRADDDDDDVFYVTLYMAMVGYAAVPTVVEGVVRYLDGV